MRRRAAVLAVASLAVLPLGSPGAQPAGLPKVAILAPRDPDFAQRPTTVLNSLLAGLAELGYVDGQNVALEFRFAHDALERLPALAAELVATQPDVLYTWTSGGARAVVAATSTIPIVIGPVSEVTMAALVPDFSRPARNVTGLTLTGREQHEKCLQLLKEAVPGVSRVGVLLNPLNPVWRDYPGVLNDAARALGLELVRMEARGVAEVDQAFAAAVDRGIDGLFGVSDSTLIGGDPTPPRILELITRHRLPSVSDEDEFAREGGLLSLGVNELAIGRSAADYIHRILQRVTPGELPVMRSQLALAVNLRTAATLGITIPPLILLRADEVIE